MLMVILMKFVSGIFVIREDSFWKYQQLWISEV